MGKSVDEVATDKFIALLMGSIKNKVDEHIREVPFFQSSVYADRLAQLKIDLDAMSPSLAGKEKKDCIEMINEKLKACFNDRHFSVSKPQKGGGEFVVKENRDYPEDFSYTPANLAHIKDHYGKSNLLDAALIRMYDLNDDNQHNKERFYFSQSINFGVESPIPAGYRDGKATIGVVSVTKDANFTAPRWRDVMEEINRADYEHVILDLRHVPGGSGELVEYGLPYFCEFEEGEVLVESTTLTKAKGVDPKLRFRKKVTVLIDDKTMSNAETAASVAQKSGLTIVGEPTAGMWMYGDYGSLKSLGLDGLALQIPNGPIKTLGTHFGPKGAEHGDFSGRAGVIPKDSVSSVETIIQQDFPGELFRDNQIVKLSDDTEGFDRDNHQLHRETGVFEDKEWLDRL